MIRRVKSRFRQCQKLEDIDRIKNKIIEGRKVFATLEVLLFIIKPRLTSVELNSTYTV